MNHMAGIRPAANATVPVMALKAFQSRHLSTGRNIDPLLATHGHGTPHELHGDTRRATNATVSVMALKAFQPRHL
jgi:hypothetical protein